MNSDSRINWGTFKRHWRPKDYLNGYYQAPVAPDELEAIKFQINMLKKTGKKTVALEFGSGPTAHRTIAAASYFSEIHIADYLKENLEELKRWIDKHKDNHNWRHFVKYILECEGIKNPSEKQINKREENTRKKITHFFQADAGEKDPLGKKYRGYYAHVYSGFCADSATTDKQTWIKYMRNIASLVAPGGTFFTAALRRSSGYKIGDKYFPSANIDEEDLQEVLALDFDPRSINIGVKELKGHENQGYSGILLAHAIKRK